MAFSDVLGLAEAAFRQKRYIEYTAKCNAFTIFWWDIRFHIFNKKPKKMPTIICWWWCPAALTWVETPNLCKICSFNFDILVPYFCITCGSPKHALCSNFLQYLWYVWRYHCCCSTFSKTLLFHILLWNLVIIYNQTWHKVLYSWVQYDICW